MTAGGGGGELPVSALVALLAAVLAIGESVILAKRVSVNHPVMTNAVGMVAGAAALLVASALAGEPWAVPHRADVVWAVAYLVVPGSIGLFLLVLVVVRAWTASASSYAFVLFPVVTLALAAVLLDEPVTPRAVAGALLVMLGVWSAALSPGARRLATAPG
jgi:drug/metabolite transporter (DMT)-like permease